RRREMPRLARPCRLHDEPQVSTGGACAQWRNAMRADGAWAGWAGMVAAAALFWPAVARAQIETTLSPVGEANWSATAGRTAGAGNAVLHAAAGWPGI